MSRLFLATDLRHSRRVVVKVLSPELVSTTSTARFKREIELTVRLQHPHILPILTSGAWEDWLYYITPFIPGESLRERIARDGKLPLDDVVKILRDASGALAFAHSRGVVHRDVKPGNILLADGHAILADFGIARAVSSQETPLTGSGMTPGTPAYMAPELPTDQSADVYALGVVAYEMLCGVLPKRGVTAKEILQARGRVRGDDQRQLRTLSSVAADALAQSTENRIASAQAMVERLEGLPRVSGLSVRVQFALAAVIVAAVVAAGVLSMRSIRRPLNAARYVVTTLSSPGDPQNDLVRPVGDALREWQGVSVVDESLVGGVVRRDGTRALTMPDLWRLGRELDSRNIIAVDARRDVDSVVVRATLYDAVGDSSVKVRDVVYATTDGRGAQTMAMRRLINGLVRDGDELPWTTSSSRAAPSLPAWRSYDAGRQAIRRWDLARADTLFRAAVAAEPRLALAHLWLAQTMTWSTVPGSPIDARAPARRALDAPDGLSMRDSLHATGLLALADGQFPAACQAFRMMVVRDSSDLAGWLGSADCQARDDAVVRDRRVNTGWTFRGSYAAAARAYERANESGSAVADTPFRGWLLGRLSHVLYAVTNHIRLGRLADSTAAVYVAFPYLDHDTLAFAPHPAAELASGANDPPPERVQAAVSRNREMLREAAQEWVRRSPQSAIAYDSLATWTEISGGYASVGEQQLPTLEIVRRAMQYSSDSTQRLRLAISEVRLLVKDGRFSAARFTADSLLRAGAGRGANVVDGVAGLSALVGHIEQSAIFLATNQEIRRQPLPDGSPVTLPPQLADAASRLLVYTAMGGPIDSVRVAARRTAELSTSYFPSGNVASRLRATLIPPALSFAYPETADLLAAMGDGPDEMANALSLLARGDTAAARVKLVEARRLREGKIPGTSVDANYRRARLALFLADTATALAELDPVLRALPTLGPMLLSRVTQIASLVRALALRAELAARRADHATASQCARAVVDLWGNADAPLQPVVARMRVLSH
ncbi:MAG: protein kinase [Gemmatimonadetes bacterium]|nr:protein kinase [Gemmatimonadota bacterium]